MKREFSPVYLALILGLACVLFRLASSHYPGSIPNVSPLMAIAFVGAMYLPRRWGWLVVPATLVLTELAFLEVNYQTDGSGTLFSWMTVASVAFYAAIYAAASVLGLWIARQKSLPKIVCGSVVCSLVFYGASNTLSWWFDGLVHMTPGYPLTLAGWWQANSVGLPGYPPTWTFLRNGIAGDLFFGFVLLLVLDRSLLWGQSPAKTAPRLA